MDLSLITEKFKRYAISECKGSSQLYEHLAEQISGNMELIHMAAHARQGQPIPNLFLGAVHYLLLKGIGHDLRDYYVSIASKPKSYEKVFPLFLDFCRQHEKEIITLLQSKLVQTNEVRRCAYLYPAFCYIYERSTKPLALIEIGTSAGLQLFWDQYKYSYDTETVYGNSQSELEIKSEIRGANTLNLHKKSPPVTARIGIDLHINDLKNDEDCLWLRALIWPGHSERLKIFQQAAYFLKTQSCLELIKGNGMQLLEGIVARIAQNSVVCIFHTHVANQIAEADKIKLTEHIRKIGEERDVFHLYNNMWDRDLHLDYYLKGTKYKETLAETDSHGRWFQWRSNIHA